MKDKTTHFGYREVPIGDKVRMVRQVFDSVSGKYDVMNDLMSLGIHRLWKRTAVLLSNVRQGERVLDLAGGTGDLTILYEKRVGTNGSVVLADINRSMLEAGRDRLIDHGLVSNIFYAQANAECLPFADSSFDCVCIAFGLRNVTDKDAALKAMYRVLKPGGRSIILEFSHPKPQLLQKVYNTYSFKILPMLGKLIANDADSYRYLAESISMHPDQDRLRSLMEQAGFEHCDYFNLTQGIVAVHRGYRL
ncbi:MAG: bifunctional demethylmenaquinone methyltransferase/2-methoxy-6-polyprenyl-1,4-benzoquinol methylase UbiE [Methylococcaceae bacterium]|nr:bifunctional demethylmenaquinone methyltransferase/2-methoxy-6-polyprenyl-1,4-benzoquinol methylase UbiE [Methylococcaceae bacterium]